MNRMNRMEHHLHFVQSLEPLQGAGLGQAALSLHLAMRAATEDGRWDIGYGAVAATSPSPVVSVHSAAETPLLQNNSSHVTSHAPQSPPHSLLLATRSAGFTRAWPGVIQGIRRGPAKAFYAPELKQLAAEAIASAEWFHGHGLYVWLNMWLGGEARKQRKPLVYHPQGFFDPWILHRSPGKKRIAHWLFEDNNFAHVRWWRAVTNKEAGQIRTVVGKHAVIHVIPNGVSLEEVDADGRSDMGYREARVARRRGEVEDGIWEGRTQAEPKLGETAPRQNCTQLNTENSAEGGRHGAWSAQVRPKRLLFLSRIHPKKGLDLLVPAWGKLTHEFPDWELLIVGPDEGGYQAVVEKMIADAGCGGTCRIHPAVSGAEKHALLRTADLFVLPSYSEGFPMAVLEAAAHRLPVVQATECNFPELTAAGGAWECRPEREALEKELRKALTAEDAERTERGARGRVLVEKNYSWEKIANQVLDACGASNGS